MYFLEIDVHAMYMKLDNDVKERQHNGMETPQDACLAALLSIDNWQYFCCSVHSATIDLTRIGLKHENGTVGGMKHSQRHHTCRAAWEQHVRPGCSVWPV